MASDPTCNACPDTEPADSSKTVGLLENDHTYAVVNCAVTNAYNRGTMCDFQAHEVHLIPIKSVHGFSKSSAFVATDKKVRHNTGFPNKATFLSMFALLRAKAERMRY